MASKPWSDPSISDATGVNSVDYFLIVQGGVNKRVTQQVLKESLTVNLFNYFTDVQSVNAAETDLYSSNIAANTLSSNGDRLDFKYSGTLTNGLALTEVLKIYFGGTEIFDSATFVTLANMFVLTGSIIRVSSTVVRYSISLVISDDVASIGSIVKSDELTGLSLSSANVLKITGQGVTTGDVTAKMGAVDCILAP